MRKKCLTRQGNDDIITELSSRETLTIDLTEKNLKKLKKVLKKVLTSEKESGIIIGRCEKRSEMILEN